MTDFYEAEEPKNPEVLRQRLHIALQRYKKLSEDQLNWEDSNFFEAVCEYIGDFPPVALLEAITKFYKKKLLALVNGEIPEVLQEMGVSQLTTEDGTKVTLAESLNVTVKNKPLFFQWLEENGEADSLKTTIELGKGEDTDGLEKFLNERGYTYKSNFDIHWQTRNKILGDRLKEGAPLPPEEAAEISVFNTARIK